MMTGNSNTTYSRFLLERLRPGMLALEGPVALESSEGFSAPWRRTFSGIFCASGASVTFFFLLARDDAYLQASGG